MTGVTGAYIHTGTANQDRHVLIGLFNKMSGPPTGRINGILAKRTITSSDVKGNTTSKMVIPQCWHNNRVSTWPGLSNSSSAYVNVNTQMHQNGEIHGQIGLMK